MNLISPLKCVWYQNQTGRQVGRSGPNFQMPPGNLFPPLEIKNLCLSSNTSDMDMWIGLVASTHQEQEPRKFFLTFMQLQDIRPSATDRFKTDEERAHRETRETGEKDEGTPWGPG
ncbi:hypothetical protein N7468_008295 [Penicillium chermesinum]|uniref:Uncharacterized protein n=1 Tax=Penicillium chermesinum TaxID=63820 RepID=A0A9W9NPX5_9EURO|nr:uncharacterized protein N7468_008295 [Penicillium chermesinum]KAJ5223753.1 hypothetical protein N7468_008295 [Penicillium chermesinum]